MSKPTKEQRKLIKEAWGDWAVVHMHYDDIIKEKLRELDPEFVKEMDRLTKDAEFWYA
jgi:hypothetical protein